MLAVVKLNFLVRCLFALIFCAPVPLLFAAEYIGEEGCQACHQEEYQAWQGSDHQLAMQVADKNTVLGDFSHITFSKDGITTTFFTDQNRIMVNTEGPDGKLQDYQISHVFGVYPLQQYMVKFPKGKIQVLDIAWDSRPLEQGGQRWFSLHPDEIIPAGDILHWTGPNLNWNYMCADCHSTNLQKNFDLATENYDTTWTDISVSCEACHGPGSEHKAWADTVAAGGEYKIENKGLTVSLDERQGVEWHTDSKTGLPVRSLANNSRAEIQVCARCHSRRSQLSDDFVPGQPFMNAYHPALLTEGLYYADGQMQEEVYVWGSFRQSKMYQAGVSCSDCHDPHAADLKLPGEQVCYQCHAPDRYASKEHHFHEPESEGASCVECHMPATTFMGIDKRNDHAFRIPRPDVSVSQGTPNACNQCHRVQKAEWSLEQLKKWYGSTPRGYQDYAGTLSAARLATIDAPGFLQQLAMDVNQPGIARATAFSQLGAGLNQNSLMLIQQGLNDEDPLVRQGALTALETAPPEQRILALPAVWDEVRSVRIQAARLMAAYPAGQLREDRQAKLDSVIEEYVQSQKFVGERPEAQLNLASLHQDRQQFVEAELAYRKALQLQAQFVPAYVNFAHMLSGLGREIEAANLLSAGIDEVAESADLYHALGLSKIRQQQTANAINDLARATSLAPESRRYQYVYAIALQSVGDIDKALEVLQASLERNPSDLEVLYALVTFNRDAGRKPSALKYAKQLQSMLPENPDITKLVQSLQ
jgi:predicted CXXCH cytochrome family protein